MNRVAHPIPAWLDHTDSVRWLPNMFVVQLPHGAVVRDNDMGQSFFIPHPTPSQRDWADTLGTVQRLRAIVGQVQRVLESLASAHGISDEQRTGIEDILDVINALDVDETASDESS